MLRLMQRIAFATSAKVKGTSRVDRVTESLLKETKVTDPSALGYRERIELTAKEGQERNLFAGMHLRKHLPLGKYSVNTSKSLLPTDESISLPLIQGRAVTGQMTLLENFCRSRKVTQLLIAYNGLGEYELDQWREPFQKWSKAIAPSQSAPLHSSLLQNIMSSEVAPIKPATDPLQSYQMLVIEGWTRIVLTAPLSLAFVRRKVPAERYHAHMNYYGQFVEQHRQLGMRHVIFGYVFLVDSQARIRWKAHGTPLKEEIQAMLGAAEAIVNE